MISQGVEGNDNVLLLVAEGLEEIRRVGGRQLARQCEWELQRLGGLMHCLEELVHADAEPAPLAMNTLFEREDLAKWILRQEASLRRLHRRHRAILAKMDAYLDDSFFLDAGSLEGEVRLKLLEHKKMQAYRAIKAEERVLQLLRQEEEEGEAAFSRLQQRQEAKTRARQAAELVAVKTKIASFSLLKLM